MSTKKRRVLILGRPGVGKTRLAGTFPNPYYLQLEPDGCTSGFPGITDDAILDIPMSAGTLDALDKTLDAFMRADASNGHVELKSGYKVQTVILDSIDAIQQTVATFDPMLKGKLKWSYDEWGILLNKVRPINMKLQALPLHVVMVAHTRTFEAEGRGQPGVMTLSVQGALARELPRWFSCILHIVEGPNMKRKVATQPTIYRGYRVEAKDRHDLLINLRDKEGIVDLPATNGYPSDEIAKALCS